MRLDNISKPETLWYEDEKGNRLPSMLPQSCEFPEGWKYQHFLGVTVSESICTHFKDPKWPIRFLKWVIRHLPYSWQGNNSQIGKFETTINCVYPTIKYLVDIRKWNFSDACIASSILCERCMNICEWEVAGEDLNSHAKYLYDVNTSCRYCNEIDPEHLEQKRVIACYRAMKFGKSVKEAWEKGYCYRDELVSPERDRFFRRFKNWFYR